MRMRNFAREDPGRDLVFKISIISYRICHLGMSLNTVITITTVFLAAGVLALAQEAAPPTVDLKTQPEPTPMGAPTAEPLPSVSPELPELSRLDEAFKRTSIGKAADEFRQRVEIRKLQNRVGTEESVVAARRVADQSSTDLEKRERLREYYDIYYGKMRRLASDEETRKALDDLKAMHVKLLDQPKVRPIPGASLPPVPKKDKSTKPKKSRFGRTTGS